MNVREIEIEEYWHKEVASRGGFTYKLTVPGRRSVPDRLTMLPLLGIFFVELKRPGEKPTAAQKREHNRIREWGGVVEWFDTKFEIDKFLISYDLYAPRLSATLH